MDVITGFLTGIPAFFLMLFAAGIRAFISPAG